MAGTATVAGTFRVACGANSLKVSLDRGWSVKELRELFADELNIPQGAKALVSGNKASESYKLRPGDELEFVKAAGVKG